MSLGGYRLGLHITSATTATYDFSARRSASRFKLDSGVIELMRELGNLSGLYDLGTKLAYLFFYSGICASRVFGYDELIFPMIQSFNRLSFQPIAANLAIKMLASRLSTGFNHIIDPYTLLMTGCRNLFCFLFSALAGALTDTVLGAGEGLGPLAPFVNVRLFGLCYFRHSFLLFARGKVNGEQQKQNDN
jgi:hypothetical protein